MKFIINLLYILLQNHQFIRYISLSKNPSKIYYLEREKEKERERKLKRERIDDKVGRDTRCQEKTRGF